MIHLKMNTEAYEIEYNILMTRIKDVFAGSSGFNTAQSYIRGLLGSSNRKNGWQLAEHLGKTTPYAIQQFLYRGRFCAHELRDIGRIYISERLGDDDGVPVVDETGFLKQGKKTCGVKRQYSGTAGRIENCQIGVFLSYSSPKGHCPIDRRLYLPEEWINDKERRKAAGVPESAVFQTKPQMALEMIRQAAESDVPYTWVTGDCVYGDYRDIRMWLEEQGKYYVMSVSGKEYVWRGSKQVSIKSLIKDLPEEGWFCANCGDGSKGERLYDRMTIDINPGTIQDHKRSVLVRRNKNSPDELRAYICYAPENTPAQKLLEIAARRWTIETCFKEAKSEVGLDQYEVRSYGGWYIAILLMVVRQSCPNLASLARLPDYEKENCYKHITFANIALALLFVLSSRSPDTKTIQQHDPKSSSLDDFKRGRNLRV